MKYYKFIITLTVLVFVMSAWLISCNNPAGKESPMSFAKAIESTSKPVRDSIKITDASGKTVIVTVRDTYKKSVTVSYDSVVFITSYVPTSIPVDTVVVPPPAGYALTYENTFSNPIDIDPDDHGQRGNSYLDNGWFRSRPADVSAGIRGEVQLDNDRLPLEGAVTYTVQYLYVVQNQCHSFQIHGSTDGSSAILAMWHINGNFVVRTNSGGANISQTQAQQKIVVGKVYEMRVEYKIGTSGYYRWYIDGKLYASYTGKIQNGLSQWIKLGFNGGFDKNKTEAMKSDIKYDNWRIYKKI